MIGFGKSLAGGVGDPSLLLTLPNDLLIGGLCPLKWAASSGPFGRRIFIGLSQTNDVIESVARSMKKKLKAKHERRNLREASNHDAF